MGKKSFQLLLCILIFVAFAFPASAGGPTTSLSSGRIVNLTVLYLNDMHGHILPQIEPGHTSPIGGASNLARMIEDERNLNREGAIFLAAGDMFQGTPISNIFRGRPVLDLLNALKLDAMTVGNHEFDRGSQILMNLAAAARFPFLAANITDSEAHSLLWTKPYLLLDRRGLKIAVVGITTSEIPYVTKPDNIRGLSFEEPSKILPALIEQLRNQKTDLIIVLSHIGLDRDRILAQKVRGIDVIIGGHSHTAIPDPVVIGTTLIVQAKCCNQYLGVLKLRIDSIQKKIIGYKNFLRTVSSGSGDPFNPDIEHRMQEYNDRIKAEFSRIVGETRTDLLRNPSGESALGNLVCDAMRNATDAEIAFQNSGGIRADIQQGKISLERVFMVLPFDDELISMDLTGTQILSLLERNARQGGKGLQISGLKVKYDFKRPAGNRIVDVTIGGKSLDPEKTSRVTTNDFLAAGGDRFGIFKQGKNIVHGGELREAFIDFIKTHSPLNLKPEGRIEFY